MTSIAERVIAIAEELSAVEANVSSRLLEDLDLDSLDRVQLAIELEKQFDIVISDADVDDPALGVLSGLIAYVERKVAQRLTPAVVADALFQKRELPNGRIAYDRPGAEL